jgi:hypothetical protein
VVPNKNDGRATQQQESQSQSSHVDVCVWEGVECSSSNQILSLTLAETDLSATIPSELALLTESRPVWIYEQTLYYRGTIPSEVAAMTSLVTLILKDNRQITGTNTNFHSPKLKYLDSQSHGIAGIIPTRLWSTQYSSDCVGITRRFPTGFLPYGLGTIHLI